MKTGQRNRFVKARNSRKGKQACRNAVKIEGLEDRTLLTVFVTTNADTGPGSLRDAITSVAGGDTIQFQIGSGPVKIDLASALPAITVPVTIDGTSQPGYAGTPLIWVDGGSIGFDGLQLEGGSSQIKGLALTGFNDGIVLSDVGANTIQANYIGVDPRHPSATTGNFSNGINVQSTNNLIGGIGSGQGNVISLNGNDGILVGGDGTTILGNLIGTDASGHNEAGNGIYGVEVNGAAHTIIGGSVAGTRNVLSANGVDGVAIESATDAVVAGNYIGVDSSGASALGNVSDGVSVTDTLAGSGIIVDHNVIAGSIGDGILLVGAGGVTIAGNLIGANYTGMIGGGLFGNAGDNIRLESDSSGTGSDGNLIGGNTAAARNVIVGGDGNGIEIDDSSNNSVFGNYIGVSANGLVAIGVGQDGVYIDGNSTGNLIGGAAAGQGNVISANAGHGIDLEAPSIVKGNRIGLGADGTTALGNLQDGIFVDSDGNIIGGIGAGEGNEIAYNGNPDNGDTAVVVADGTGNAIRGNSIHDNAAIGIDLIETNPDDFTTITGRTENHTPPADSGPNNLQNFPVFTLITQNAAGVTIQGTLNADPNLTSDSTRAYAIDLFANNPSLSADHVEGQVYLGTVMVLTDGSGNATFNVTYPGANPLFNVFTATATDADGNTSEFSDPTESLVNAPPAQAPTSTTLASSDNPSVYGEPVTFTATVNPTAGGPGVPTGNIVFKDGSTTLATIPLTGNSASIQLLNIALGAHTITATYSGDTSFQGSSVTLTQNVNQAATTTTLTPSSASPSFGQPVTFTATVSPIAPGDGVPSGNVVLSDGATVLATVALSGETATFSNISLGVGTHNLTAQYVGDTSFVGSMGSAVDTVTPAATSTTVAAAPNPSVFGQSVIVTATVMSTAGTPTGTVMFYEGMTHLGMGTLSGGVASISLSGFSVGSHPITAVYSSDDTSFSDSTGSTSQLVNKADSTTTVASSVMPSVFGQSVTLTASVAIVSPGAGVASGTVTFFDGATPLGTASISGGQATLTLSTLGVGHHSITAQYQGDGNFNASTSPILDQLVNAAATSTTITSSSNPSPFGQAVIFTATVTTTLPGSGTPTGNVTFSDGATVLGTVALVGGVATFNDTALTTGTHSITASYAGTPSFNASTASLTQNVTALATATTVATSPNPSTIGQPVTLTATVTGGNSTTGAPTGTVTFFDGATSLGTGTLSSGVATLSVNSLAVGSHSITAVYGADANFNTSTSAPATQVVNAAATTTTLASSTNPSPYGQPVTFTATVTTTATGAGPFSGSVTFMDGSTTLGTSPIVSGVATISAALLSTGSHSITAIYSGSTNYNPSSASLTQSVAALATATAVATSPNPSTKGQSVTLTATVTGGNSITGEPTGIVTFFDGTISLGTGTLSSGVATLSVNSLAVGSHSITATYGADTNFNTSTSAPATQVVNAASTTTTLTSSSNPSPFGQAVVFTATVSTTATGAGTPDGNVTFSDGMTVLGIVPLIGGVATFNDTSLATGSHPITASYSGSTNFNASNASLTQNVTSLATATTVATSPNPSTVGQAVTLTATVTGGNSTTGAPTGTVTFFDGTTSLGTGTLAGGVATLSVSSLAVGSHSITAVYGSDANFNASTSAPATQVVNAASTTTTLGSSANPSPYGQPVTFTATVTTTATGAGPIGGTVTFKDGSATLGTSPVVGGIATISAALLSTGSHSITATYSGNTNYNPSSAALTQSVTALATTTTVATSPNPSTIGQPVTLTATVTGGNSTTGAPTGTVTFFDGATSLGTGTLASGVATVSVSSLAIGSHSITAVYGSDANFNASTSTPFTQVVNAASTTTTLASSANPSPYGQAVTFTATVTTTATGAGPISGTVTFMDGSTTLGSSPVVGGVATISAALLSTGSHSITATYSGSTNFNASSASLTQNVTALATVTTVAGTPNPSTIGQAVTLTATVTGGNSTTGAPAGTVTFFDGATSLGTGTLSGGVATLSISTLTAGSHTITAVYGGNSNFNPSTSAPATQSVISTGTVSGFVYNDANNNGIFEGGELPISGVTLTLTGTNDLSQPVTLTASSDSTGAYRFNNLRPGTYSVTETQPAGYGDGLDAKNNVVITGSNTTDAISGITLLSGATAANNNFGELQLIISGTVLTDTTGNGLSDDDTPQSGVLVNLYADTNHSGTLDTGDAIIDHATTGTSGTYTFTKLPGRYFIQEVTPTGYLRTAPAVATFYNINAPIGGASIGNDFDNFLADCDLSDISNVSYLINGTTIVSQLRGNTHQGDVVEAIFTIAAGEAPHPYSLVSYTAPSAVFDGSVANQQMVSDTDTEILGPGVHTLTVTIPDSYYQIDFVCGNIIDRLGPANSNIFYTPQGRLIDADNGGTQAVLNGPGSISGFTYIDINKNGLIDLNDGTLEGVKVTLSGTNDLGKSVSMVEFSDSDGQYFFGGLRPGTYSITETQPTGVQDGRDTLGTIAGAPSSNFGTVSADKFSSIKIANNQDAVNYNFGEVSQTVQCGQAATIGFWQNSNGQSLIKALNGGSSSTNLGIWLASTYPNLYGTGAGVANLLGKTNAQIASFYSTLFKTTSQKIDAQVLGVALAIYVTDSGHAGTVGTSYGFTVNDTGLAVSTFNVGSNGAAFGVTNNTTLTVGDLLQIADSRSWAGVLWDVDHTGSISAAEQAWRNMANTVFSGINNTGDIN